MYDISAVSPITFYESSLSSQRINFTPNANSNSSPVGMQQGGNRVLLANGGFNKGSAIHEIMHSLGIFHEQSRSDRDSYLIINWNNIAAGKEHNFNKYAIDYKGIDVGTFDFNSIMLYSSTAFSKNNEPTMLRKSDGEKFYANESNLSDGDIAGINCFYGPTMGIKSTVTGGYDESGNDYIDRRTDYSHEVYFYSATGERITLEYPRLIVVKCINGTRSSSSQPMNESVSILYFLAPAGSSSYSLPATSDYYQSDMGYIRWEEYTRYYIEN